MKLQLERSIEIKTSAAELAEKIVDFNQWPAWNPWLILEPEATVAVQGLAGSIGHSYSWQGQRVGAGSMRITNIDTNKLTIALEFLKPFRSQATVSFNWVDLAQSTRLTWSMDSKLPLLIGLFFGRTMLAAIGFDYRRGLLLLKDFCEQGNVNCTLSNLGIQEQAQKRLIGPKRRLNLAHFEAENRILFDTITAANVSQQHGLALIYSCQKLDKNQFQIEVHCGAERGHHADNFSRKRQEKGRFLCLELKGDRVHFGSLWAYGESLLNSKQYRQRRGNAYYRLPCSQQDTTASLIHLYLPVK